MAAHPYVSWFQTDLQELRNLVFVTLVMALAFSWRFAGPPTLGNWYNNFILVLILVAVSVFIHELVHRLVARKFLARVKSKVFLSGIVAMLLLTLITNGWLVIAVPWAVSVLPLHFFRPGKGDHLGPYETALIALSGPLANFALAIIAKLLLPNLGLIAQKLLVINVAMAVFNLFPFF